MLETNVSGPKRRRWLVHVIWFFIVLLAFWGGVKFGFRIYNATLGMMILDNNHFDKLGQIRVSLRLLGDDDLSVHRRSEAMSLRTSVVALSNMPRYAPCRPKDADALTAAKGYLSDHPMAIEKELGDIYTAGLSYCDKPADPYPYPYLLF